MLTGDGLLVRVSPTDSITLHGFAEFCAAARRHGNGTIEVTGLGSLQVRGLTPSSCVEFANAVARLGIDGSHGIRVIYDPIADHITRLVDARSLAVHVRAAVSKARIPLSPKACVIVDDGGRLPVDRLAADLRLCAGGSPDDP